MIFNSNVELSKCQAHLKVRNDMITLEYWLLSRGFRLNPRDSRLSLFSKITNV